MKPKKVHGVGINDSDVRDSFYWTWVAMLDRCYNPKVKPRNVTYAGCTVAPEWLTFSNFKAWMLRQPWQGCHLDKDILFPGNRIYSPETCVFITPQTNTVLSDCARARGDYPIGVSYDKSRGLFLSRVRRQMVTYNLGRFSDPMDAHAAWQREKAKIIREIAEQQVDWRVGAALLARAEKLDNNRLRGVETIKL